MIIINVATAMAPLASVVLNVALAVTDFIKILLQLIHNRNVNRYISHTRWYFMTIGPAIQFGAIDFIGGFIEAYRRNLSSYRHC